MDNSTVKIKLQQRLNKLSSNDYDNIEDWQVTEAFNKAAVEWSRRQLHGGNIYKEGDEFSKRRIDDMQVLLRELPLTGVQNDDYFETTNFPIDEYLEFKRVTTKAKDECCPDPRTMTVYLAEEANVNQILRDPLKNPNFDWAETFCTILGNKIRIYKNKDFSIVEPVLTYYKRPTYIQFANVLDPYSGTVSPVDVESDFKDDIVELILDEAAAIISGDIDNYNQMQRDQQAAERSN
mgnify:CR=1 FL=1|jgi:hypothetical protein|tara:strand:- start:787 stop:1494 length:708 start_codon:yes stop_codon:yes gene_type:complete